MGQFAAIEAKEDLYKESLKAAYYAERTSRAARVDAAGAIKFAEKLAGDFGRDVSADLAPLLDLIAFSPEDEDLVAAAADDVEARVRRSSASAFEPYFDFAMRAVDALFS